ncbi:poly(U)-specific endoribonuclease-B isoform X2 [Quercus lobata]|uniref:poly(U)-specific endoribonuclease-B isoform X2 n=1 Tax=Quercus lobata TaxID=97700 RepID=UPI00124654B8|nr:poly(U)-specific endoribonuclease-B isoform X2 [Quercus lobata]
MEGLIKGLIDVALGHGNNNNNNNNDDDEQPGPQDRDEQSRSTWAQVVTGEQDNEEEDDNRRSGHRTHHASSNQNRWNRQENAELGNEEWRVSGSRPSRSPQYQKTVHEEYGKYEDAERQGYNKNHWNKEIQKDQWHGYKRPASEQEYSDEVEIGDNIEPSEEELADLSQACNKLWELDLNRLVPGKDYEIDCGEGKKVYQKEDMAQGSLFSRLSEDIFRRPTFSRFFSLLDNYNPDQGHKEVVTSEERQEQAAFIEEISRTAPIKYLHKYLSSKGVVPENYQDFKRMMTSLWFDLYGRGGTSGSSSAFEHVFVGEIKQRGEQEVSGFHNWLQFYLEEAKGRVDYQGYIFPRRRGQTPDYETQLITVQFEWNGVLKSVSSMFVGVSPEFEVALYALCFYMGGEDNYIQLGPYPVNIKCYRLGDRIGSVFPIAEC